MPYELEPNDLMLFARVVDEGSFSRAAARAGLPKSTVSRRIAMLEAQLGERLLLRTTRKLTVTDFGHSVLEHAHQVMAEVQAASAWPSSARCSRAAGCGCRCRATSPTTCSDRCWRNSSPGTRPSRWSWTLSPRRVDLIGENFDLALRMGDLPDDASLAARRLAVFAGGLYASPGYLRRRGEPVEPEALMEHDALRLLARNGEPAPWLLSRGEARWEGIPPGRVTANSPELLMRMARHGTGITALAHHFAEPYLRSGELEPVLADWALPPAAAWAVFPGRRLMPARTRVFLDTLEAEFAGPRCQPRITEEGQAQRERVKRKATFAA